MLLKQATNLLAVLAIINTTTSTATVLAPSSITPHDPMQQPDPTDSQPPPSPLEAHNSESRTTNPPPQTANPQIATLFQNLTRSTTWSLLTSLPLKFQTHHPQGLAITPTHLFLSSVEILIPPVPYPAPDADGYDRSPGKGVGHVFVLTRAGKLVKDITLHDDGNGDRYHPGGIDFDGSRVWVPLAEYRPKSSARIFSIDAETLEVERHFVVRDHVGSLLRDPERDELVGATWGAREFLVWQGMRGREVRRWRNGVQWVDWQDGQFVGPGFAVVGGVAGLKQSPAVVGAGSGQGQGQGQVAVQNPMYELGGVGLVDLRSGNTVHEVPVSVWSKVGHSINRNPMKMVVGKEGALEMWVAPDDGVEMGGTRLLRYRAG